MNTGEEVRFFKGNLFEKVVASCSVPLVFKPVEIDWDFYADGGIMNNLPADCLRQQCDVVIGFNVVPLAFKSSRSLRSFWSIAQRIFELEPSVNVRHSAHHCDVLIQPADVGSFTFFSLKNADILFDLGYEATVHRCHKSNNCLIVRENKAKTPYRRGKGFLVKVKIGLLFRTCC